MVYDTFRLPLYLPAQGAAETEATIVAWRVAEGEAFDKGQVLCQVDSAKSVFDFEAPCAGRVLRLLHGEGDAVAYDQAVMEIETADQAMRDWIPPAAEAVEPAAAAAAHTARVGARLDASGAALLGIGGYLPSRVVTNAELVAPFPAISDDYVYQVTGIRERRWAGNDEKPSDMAYAASVDALEKSGLTAADLDLIILATTTPDVAMPSTACILQDRLQATRAAAFDLNAACSGWLYAVTVARSMILAGAARSVLTVGVDVQSHLLDHDDQTTCFLFGDGAGAAVISAASTGHRIRETILGSDPRGLHFARRSDPGYVVANGHSDVDPWIRLDGQPLFRFATESFAEIVRQVIEKSGWTPEETRWIVPHQANGRILKAAARRSRVSYDRFFVNVERVGNTSSASIPLALLEMEQTLRAGDKLVLCSVGAGMTTAAVSIEW